MVARLLSLGVHHRQGKHPYASAPFSFDKNARKILLKGIRSGYSVQELETPEDRYGDKPLHREFLLHFAQSPKA